MLLKRTIQIVLCILLIGTIPALAIETRVIPMTPTLTFNGTTALCGVSVSYYGANIAVTLELRNGNVLVDSWNKNRT